MMDRQLATQPGHEARGHQPDVGARPGWGRPKPDYPPQPTYWPVVLALGLAFLFWGLISTPLIALVGLALGARGLAGWIGELRHEH